MDWNHRYETDDTPWDKGRATPVLDEIHFRSPGLFGGSILVPGCGAGHDARWLARAGARVTGVDIAPLAIEAALRLAPPPSVVFEVADFLHPPAHHLGAFDLLWEHTCFCALDPSLRRGYIRSASRVLKPEGTVAGVFFIDPEMDPGETGPPFGIGLEELEALWREEGFDVLDLWTPVRGYPGRVGRERVMILRKTR